MHRPNGTGGGGGVLNTRQLLVFEKNLPSSDIVSDGDVHGRSKTQIVCCHDRHVTSRARALDIPARTT